jgi:hypothetical protein
MRLRCPEARIWKVTLVDTKIINKYNTRSVRKFDHQPGIKTFKEWGDMLQSQWYKHGWHIWSHGTWSGVSFSAKNHSMKMRNKKQPSPTIRLPLENILNKQKCHFFFYRNGEQEGKTGPVWGVSTSGRRRI